jgi:hypothetical protein
MRDLAKDAPAQAVLDFMSKAVAFGRPIATTPGVPAERVAALRRAFDLTLKDPAFLQEAKMQRAELLPMTGVELEGIVRDIIGSPLDRRERVRRAIQPANAKEISGKAGANE